jgi:hypothetical protein
VSWKSDEISPIQINDRAFLIASTIERCPKTMMLRELMMNALDAARLAPASQRYVIFSVKPFDGVPKLAIWNTGPGMDAEELYRMCDLAASIRKNLGLDANFGMGAKVASLPSNRLGVRYRSCKDKRVHEVILCERKGIYGRLRRRAEDGTYSEVIDVTEVAAAEGLDLTYDWTEVLLLGNQHDQDTARDPYDGDPKSDTQWLANYLYHRFYRLPSATRVVLKKGTHKLGDGARTFETLSRRVETGVFQRSESVRVGDGIIVHYLFDAHYEGASSHNRSISNGLQTDLSLCAIVHKNEMYDVRKRRSWTLDAPLLAFHSGRATFQYMSNFRMTMTCAPRAIGNFFGAPMANNHKFRLSTSPNLLPAIDRNGS